MTTEEKISPANKLAIEITNLLKGSSYQTAKEAIGLAFEFVKKSAIIN